MIAHGQRRPSANPLAFPKLIRKGLHIIPSGNSGGNLFRTPVLLLLLSLSLPNRHLVAHPSAPRIPEYRLRFYHTHTGERLEVIYRHGNTYDPAEEQRLDKYLRDYRTGEVRKFDARLFDLLHDLMLSLDRPDGEIDVVCGYRTPRTNEYLRTHGHGVARKSLHMQAMAIDIRIPGVTTTQLRDAALSLGRGGVGYYGPSHFVHVDVGPVRRW